MIPIKRFGDAKQRLAGALSTVDRQELARRMATHVLDAARPLEAFVVCDDPDVASWTVQHAAEPLLDHSRGLNAAVAFGFAELRTRGFQKVIIAHSDLPFARDLAWLAEFRGITIVPDRVGEGTNVICVPTDLDFTFAYGRGSFEKHFLAAKASGASVRIVNDHALAIDIDLPTDVALAKSALARAR